MLIFFVIFLPNIDEILCASTHLHYEEALIDKVVSPSQNAFVEGRQILDATLIVNEVVNSMLRRNNGGVVCKLDIENAYNHLNWEFVLEVMRRKGFGQRWLNWISWCMSIASFSILINGTSAGFFRSTRGL